MVTHVCWEASVRIISARLPRIDIFERLVDPSELGDLLAIEALTNPRIRNQIGNLELIPRQRRVVGPGSTFIMAAFTYPVLGRFSDEQHGAYYAADTLATAVAETKHHRERFLARTPTPPMELDMRVIEARIEGELTDIRAVPSSDAVYADDATYAASRAFAERERARDAAGIVYRSVRRAEGACVAIFDPRCVGGSRTTKYLGYRWDGARIIDVYEKASLMNEYA